jgi:hypothetical protein
LSTVFPQIYLILAKNVTLVDEQLKLLLKINISGIISLIVKILRLAVFVFDRIEYALLAQPRVPKACCSIKSK